MTKPKMWGIYRQAGPSARARRKTLGEHYGIAEMTLFPEPRPKRVAVIEAPTRAEALEAFAKAEMIRSVQVVGWEFRGENLALTYANGRNVHDAIFMAWRKEER